MDRDYITERRERLISQAAHRIGIDTTTADTRVLRRSGIPSYLHRIGCPMLLEGPLTLLALPSELRTPVETMAREGSLPATAGLFFTPTTATYPTAVLYGAATAAEFLRRRRPVAWYSTEEIFNNAPRRFNDDEASEEHNDFFSEMTQVYELLIVHGVMAFGHSEWEQRT